VAIANKSTYDDRVSGSRERLRINKSQITAIAARSHSMWVSAGVPATGVAPTTAAVPTNATTGALGQQDGTLNRILKMVMAWTMPTGGFVTVADRLSHQGGLSGVTTGAQATNLPTAALTRKTSGVGVQLGLEIYTSIGATATTVSASYTNTTPTSGRTTPLATWGGTGFNTAPRIVILPLQSGDNGVTAVANVTNTATTGTAGAFGVTLFYPLISVPIQTNGDMWFGQGTDAHADSGGALYEFGTWFTGIDAGACLFFITHSQGTAAGFPGGAEIHFAED
jgi:hypothetical protein